uniref:ornithine aminotransferase n=1 Tax=Anthurium amnicola TaxID=1678845 RepID=A0A1D1YVZ8_9ARAE
MSPASAARRPLECLVRRCLAPARGFCAVSQATHQPERQNPSPPSPSSEELINLEYQHSAHNYHPIPMVFSRAKGTCVWDPEGNKYIDFLSAYSAVNQGHCHPKVMKALVDQAERLTLSSRAFYNDKFPLFAELLTHMFGYEMMLPMNTGAEGVETALKLARKWGYEKKSIPKDEAIIVSCCGCFHGRTLAVVSMSCDNDAACGFGPLLPGHMKVDFGDIDALEKIFKEHGDKIAAFLFEPIQGEAGVILPPDGYLKAVRDLCSRYNILMIADEIQSGIGRTGKMLACDWEEIRPDVVILGKALGAGVIPVSAVLADKGVMLCIKPGEHGSTFGGNPLASAVAVASLNVIKDEGLIDRAAELGTELRDQLMKVKKRFPHIIKEVRGRGLLNAIELNNEALSPVSAYDICLKMKERGILAKPTHSTIIRLAPPLSISLEELSEASRVLRDVLEIDLPHMQKQKTPGESSAPPQRCHRCGRDMHA